MATVTDYVALVILVLLTGSALGAFCFSAYACHALNAYFNEFGFPEDMAGQDNNKLVDQTYLVHSVSAIFYGGCFVLELAGILLLLCLDNVDDDVDFAIAFIALGGWGFISLFPLAAIFQAITVSIAPGWVRVLEARGVSRLAVYAKYVAGFSLVFSCIAAVALLSALGWASVYLLTNCRAKRRARSQRNAENAGAPAFELEPVWHIDAPRT